MIFLCIVFWLGMVYDIKKPKVEEGFMKKFLTLTITFVMVVSSAFGLTACNKDKSSKTILNVYNYGGGFGSAWLDSLEERFETAYENYSFEDGKKGVDLRYDDPKTNGMDEVSAALGSGTDVYFCQEINVISNAHI